MTGKFGKCRLLQENKFKLNGNSLFLQDSGSIGDSPILNFENEPKNNNFKVYMGVIRHIHSSKHTDDPNLGELFKEYYDRLVFFAWQMVKDKQQAEDTVQDAFIAYWQHRDQVASQPQAIKNFLYSSVKNASLNIIRHLQVVNSFEDTLPKTEQGEAYILEAIISAERIAEVTAAIAALPEHLRTISRLSFFDGKKNQEIADQLGMSVNTVKKQKQRALELLKVSLNPEALAILLTYSAYIRGR